VHPEFFFSERSDLPKNKWNELPIFSSTRWKHLLHLFNYRGITTLPIPIYTWLSGTHHGGIIPHRADLAVAHHMEANRSPFAGYWRYVFTAIGEREREQREKQSFGKKSDNGGREKVG
jgi:hypothetical protein